MWPFYRLALVQVCVVNERGCLESKSKMEGQKPGGIYFSRKATQPRVLP